MIRRPVSRPPVNETRSTRGSSESGAPALGAGAEHQVADAGRQPGLVEQAHQVDGGVRRQLAGLEHEGVAGREAGRDLPGDLEQRVVPRRDQAAHPDRLVHDPADDVGVAGVDHPAGLLGGDAAVVAEDGDHVGDVVLALDQALAGVQGLHAGEVGHVPLEQVGDAEQQVTALAGGRAPARGRRGRPGGRRRWRPGVLGAGLVDRRRPARRRPGSGSPGGRRRVRAPTVRRRRAPPLDSPFTQP